MRSNGKITAALLVAALAAVGCSKDETVQNKTSNDQHLQQSAKAQRVSMITPSADKQPSEPVKTIVGPASFADGDAAFKAGKYGEATEVFERYTLEKPDNAWGHFMLGLSASKGGDSEKAEKAFEDAIRIDPKHVKSLLNLSRVLIDKGRFDDASLKLARVGEIDPNSAEMYRLLGRTYNGQHKIDEAIDAYNQAIKMDPNDAWSLNNLGLMLLEKGQFDEAAVLLGKAVELKKDIAMFHNNLGMALEHTKQFTAAASAYKGGLDVDPGYEKAKRNLARVEAVKVDSEEKSVDEVKQPPTEKLEKTETVTEKQ